MDGEDQRWWDDGRCWVCGPLNPHGLHVEFTRGEGRCEASLVIPAWGQGFQGLAHGGVVAGLLDEAMWHALDTVARKPTVTAELAVRYVRPVALGTQVRVEASCSLARGRLYRARARLLDAQGEVLAEAEGTFLVPRERKP